MKLNNVGSYSLSKSLSLKLGYDILKTVNVKENDYCKSITFGDVFFLAPLASCLIGKSSTSLNMHL